MSDRNRMRVLRNGSAVIKANKQFVIAHREMKKILKSVAENRAVLEKSLSKLEDVEFNLDGDNMIHVVDRDFDVAESLDIAAEGILGDCKENYDKDIAEFLMCAATQQRSWGFVKEWANKVYEFNVLEEPDQREPETIQYGKDMKELLLDFRKKLLALDRKRNKKHMRV